VDNGIRNALIQDFRRPEIRQDMGELWENFFIMERIKYHTYNNRNRTQFYFWRTYQQEEVDLLEWDNNQHELSAFECKYNKNKKAKIPKAFLNAYPEAKTAIVTPQDILPYF
jgi:predicted AAA+ superfamily ATPase